VLVTEAGGGDEAVEVEEVVVVDAADEVDVEAVLVAVDEVEVWLVDVWLVELWLVVVVDPDAGVLVAVDVTVTGGGDVVDIGGAGANGFAPELAAGMRAAAADRFSSPTVMPVAGS
jgi:hypothetical protein